MRTLKILNNIGFGFNCLVGVIIFLIILGVVTANLRAYCDNNFRHTHHVDMNKYENYVFEADFFTQEQFNLSYTLTSGELQYIIRGFQNKWNEFPKQNKVLMEIINP